MHVKNLPTMLIVIHLPIRWKSNCIQHCIGDQNIHTFKKGQVKYGELYYYTLPFKSSICLTLKSIKNTIWLSYSHYNFYNLKLRLF